MYRSHPESENYGKHWTPEEVIKAFAPSQESVDKVKGWLVDNGIPANRVTHSDNQGWLAFFATPDEAEDLLQTEFHEFEDSVTGGVMPACDECHVPHHIKDHVDYITPGIKLHAPTEDNQFKRSDMVRIRKDEKKSASARVMHSLRTQAENSVVEALLHNQAAGGNKSDLSTCDVAITPACVAALYKIPESKRQPHPNNSLAVFE